MLGRRALVLAAAVVAALLVGCGGGGDAKAITVREISRAVGATQSADSARFSMQVSIDIGPQQVTIEGDGASTFDGSRAQLTMTSPLLGGELEYRVVDGVVYMSVPAALGGKLAPGVGWIRIDPKAALDDLPEEQRRAYEELLSQARGNDPTNALESLRGISGDVQEVGRESVRGRDATHYRVTIDYAKALTEAGGEQERRGLSDLLGASGPSLEQLAEDLGRQPADVWIDDDDRLVKVVFGLDFGDLGRPGAVAGGTLQVSMELYDLGTPVDVEAPPASETVDVRELAGSGFATPT